MSFKIHHLALWVRDLELMKSFYTKYFQGTAGEKYHNPQKAFHSYFVSFADDCQLELMHMSSVPNSKDDVYQQFMGFIHFAISVGSKEGVDHLTETLRTDGFEIIGEPRWTGDGFYESVVLDPENNRVEITI